MKFFDTHAHYNDEVYNDNLEETLNKCISTGVDKIINVGYNTESSKKAIELSKTYDYMYSVIGIHPHDVFKDNVANIYDLYEKNKDKKIVAIGEIGLDYAFVSDNKEQQKELFIEQIKLANSLKLPIVVHTRDASLDTYNILKENKAEYGTLLHCFHPTDDLVRLVLENGYMVAFGGNITYKRNSSFAKYVEMIPLNQIVIETDCPYLSPEPYRGKVNTSANLPIICQKLAEFKNLEYEEVAKQVYENSCKFFNIK